MKEMIIKKWSGAEAEGNVTREPIDEVNDFFARAKLISWWDQSRIEAAKVLVVGAGAIGNEVLHNLALLGVGQIFICDMDRIERSNLSRTLLFGIEDDGELKAEVAAKRTREICLAKDPRVDFFCGDVMYGLGSGIFRRFDLVLGCLDNDATRYYVDSMCTRFGKPWLNAGISELSVGLQMIYAKESGVCFRCGEPPQRVARIISRTASCGKTAISDLNAGKVPTVQVASAIVAGLQAQEAAKYLCGKQVEWGKNLYYQGTNHSFNITASHPDPECAHNFADTVTEVAELTSISNSSTMRELLEEAERSLGAVGRVSLELGEEVGRDFIRSAGCTCCGERVKIGVPRFRFKDEMALCPECVGKPEAERSEPLVEAIRYYDLDLDSELLDMTLGELGIPPLHVLSFYDEADNLFYAETTGDLAAVAPNLFGEG